MEKVGSDNYQLNEARNHDQLEKTKIIDMPNQRVAESQKVRATLKDTLLYGGQCGRGISKDKGYAWCVLIMSFLSYFSHRGFTYGVVGNLTVAHKDFFSIDLQQSSLIGTVHTSILFMFAPIASALTKKLGCRFTQIFGGACLLLGLGLSALASKQWHAMILFGIISGVGVSSTFIASSAILPHHFERHRRLAFAFASLGSFAGAAVWPILSQYLLTTYSYSKAMGIMASLHIIHVCAGLTFYQPSDADVERNEQIVICDKEKMDETEQNSVNNLGVPVSGEESTLDENNKAPDVEIGTSKPDAPIADIRESHSLKGEIITLLKSAKVWMFLVNCMLWNAGNCAFHVLINDYMVNQTSLDKEEVALGISILGVAKVLGSITNLATSPLQFDRLNLHFTSVTVYSLMTIAVPFSGTKVVYYGIVAVWGAAFAVSIGNLLAVVLELCGAELLAMLFGFELLTEGLGSLVGIPLLTLLSVQTKAEYGLVAAGCIGICGSCVLLPEMVDRFKRKNILSKRT